MVSNEKSRFTGASNLSRRSVFFKTKGCISPLGNTLHPSCAMREKFLGRMIDCGNPRYAASKCSSRVNGLT